jgi:hypothetical protein
MKKPIVGVLLGAVVYFVWGAVSWTVIPWHASVLPALPQETLVTDVFKTVIKQPGFYQFPGPPPADAEGREKWDAKVHQGPVGAVIYSPQGGEPMGADVFLKAFVTDLVIAALTMLVLFAARASFRTVVHRAHLAAVIGLIAGLATHVQYRLWFHFPIGYTVVAIIDLMIAFILMGIAMAKFVPEA